MNQFVQYNRRHKPFAQELRRNMTAEEKHLWYEFLKAYPVQFRGQKPIGNYIADFFCSQALLVVEIDGGQHFTDQGQIYDQERSYYMQRKGLYVLRFSNHEVNTQFNAVCMKIHSVVQERIYLMERQVKL